MLAQSLREKYLELKSASQILHRDVLILIAVIVENNWAVHRATKGEFFEQALARGLEVCLSRHLKGQEELVLMEWMLEYDVIGEDGKVMGTERRLTLVGETSIAHTLFTEPARVSGGVPHHFLELMD